MKKYVHHSKHTQVCWMALKAEEHGKVVKCNTKVVLGPRQLRNVHDLETSSPNAQEANIYLTCTHRVTAHGKM